jgi:hypothetical protein
MDTRDEGARLRGTGAIELCIECRAFRKFEKNTLKGFVSLSVSPPGITLNDLCLHEKFGRRWLSFPARPYQTDDGKQRWTPVVEIANREILRRFQTVGIEAIDRYVQQGGGA